MCGRRALRSRFAACVGRPGRARLGRGARECGGLTDAHGVFVSRRVEMPSCRRAAVPPCRRVAVLPCCPRLAPRASRLAPRASRLAPRASRLAPRASRLAPRASRLAPRAS
ncbi:hypothetical protein GSH02_20140, partial [Burkholderia pseudomallei]|nr:hypothetical protein [Burkholderia pseudomallei]